MSTLKTPDIMMNAPSHQKTCATCASANHILNTILTNLDPKKETHHLLMPAVIQLPETNTYLYYRSFMVPQKNTSATWIAVLGKEGQIGISDRGHEIVWRDRFSVAFVPAPNTPASWFVLDNRGEQAKKSYNRISRKIPSKYLEREITLAVTNGHAPLVLTLTKDLFACQVRHAFKSEKERDSWHSFLKKIGLAIDKAYPGYIANRINSTLVLA
ncbi:MAG: hypothetical protein WCJ25_02590 [Candidatus Moraniibacteriota bacterium]